MNHNDTIVIILSRPDSKRVPRKALRKINGIPAIKHILNRLKECPFITYVATPDNLSQSDSDQYLAAGYENPNIFYFKGNAESPLHRIAECITRHEKLFAPVNYVVRITHDDLFIDLETMIELINKVKEVGAAYGITPQIVEGAGVEVICKENIMEAAAKIKDPIEHISYYVKDNMKELQVNHIPRAAICKPYRLTLDYPEDLTVIETVFRTLGNDATLDQVCHFLDQNHYLLDYNRLPEVTFYTCVKNAEKFIQRTMRSVLSAYDDSEYIIIDDFSNDGTLIKIMEALDGFQNEKCIKIVTNETNLGLSSSSNKALSMARGKYIMRVDADDILLRDSVIQMIREIKDSEAAVVYSNYNEIDAEGNYITKDCSGKVYHHAGCALMDRKLINEIKFTEGLQHWDGFDLYNRIKRHFAICYAEKSLWLYRQHEESMSKTNLKDRRRVLKKLKQGGRNAKQ